MDTHAKILTILLVGKTFAPFKRYTNTVDKEGPETKAKDVLRALFSVAKAYAEDNNLEGAKLFNSRAASVLLDDAFRDTLFSLKNVVIRNVLLPSDARSEELMQNVFSRHLALYLVSRVAGHQSLLRNNTDRERNMRENGRIIITFHPSLELVGFKRLGVNGPQRELSFAARLFQA